MEGTMRAVCKMEPGLGFEWIDAPIPKPKMGEVLVKVHTTAICGTDVHIYKWDPWAQSRLKLPRIFGHEFCGEVVELGEGVSKTKVGQFVSVECHYTCGKCYFCRTGQGHICQELEIAGVDRDGCYAEYVTDPQDNLWTWDIDISPAVAAIQDPFGNAIHTTLATDLVGKTVFIIGIGPIGMCAIKIAKAAGAARIIASDVSEYRLNLAKELGADLVINVTKQNTVDEIMKFTNGKGIDVMIEMSGNAKGIQDGFEVLRRGGFVSMLGIPSKPVELDIANAIVFKGATVQGINGRRMFDTWYKAQDLLRGGLDINPVITHRFPFADIKKGFDLMVSGECGKVVIDMK